MKGFWLPKSPMLSARLHSNLCVNWFSIVSSSIQHQVGPSLTHRFRTAGPVPAPSKHAFIGVLNRASCRGSTRQPSLHS
eukprot:1161671-Pelagomonas_calceolata.AAC.34